MFDSEVAVTLLNRCDRPPLEDEYDRHLEILREGNLAFTYERIDLGAPHTDGIRQTESLYFRDGSIALRVLTSAAVGCWTQWTAFHPLHPSQWH